MAIYWRSGNTWTSITGNLEGLQALWQKAGMADLLPADQRATADKLDTLLKTLIATAPTIKPDIEAALADPAERAKIDELLSESRDLTTRLQRQVWWRDRPFGGLFLLRWGLRWCGAP